MYDMSPEELLFVFHPGDRESYVNHIKMRIEG